jgi:hypothetical protein
VTKLFHLIKAATRDARRAEELMHDSRSRRALINSEDSLMVFELRAGTIYDEIGRREKQITPGARHVQAPRRDPAVG